MPLTVMKSPKRSLVIVAVSTLVGCSNPGIPATMPDASASALRLFTTSSTLPLVVDLTEAYSDRQMTFEIRSGGFRTVLNHLIEGETPYFISSHLPTPEIKPLWAAPVGQDGVAMIVNPTNTIGNLELNQLREIYQGRVQNWRNLGGPNLELTVFSREEGSETRLEFERLVMGERRTTLAARLITSSDGMINAVAQTPGGIGYVSFAALDSQAKALSIEGVAPTQTTIAQHLYPLRSTLFVIGLNEPEGEYRAFIGWIQSPEGQSVVGESYVPLGVSVEP
jgi:phosphate transport system substrate-binding protein